MNVRKCPPVYLIVALWCCFAGTALYAQWRQPFGSLRVIKTEHFEIVFPPESERTAQTLAGFADRVYDQVSGLLGITIQGRIPVTLTPHTAAFNGNYTPVPYPHIVLLDVPMDIENMGTYTNALEGLFLHELTHAISLSSRAPVWEGLYKIFGGWVFPAIFTAPGFMVEGVTVSFESLDGTGRANDPLIREGLLQAAYENRFLTPLQASGLYDLPHMANPIYHYGGFFSAYLQRLYGMEKYAELWAAMGDADAHLSFKVYNSGYYDLFRRVYGRPFPEVWNEFRESFLIPGIQENPEPPVFDGISRDQAQLYAISAGGGKVFAVDNRSGKVIAYAPRDAADGAPRGDGELRSVLNVDRQAVQALAVSDDGERLLVSAFRPAGSINYVFAENRTVVTEYEIRRGRKTGREWGELYQGRYFRDGVIGISADRHNTTIVYRPEPSDPQKEEILLRGTEELIYSTPVPLDTVMIAFIAAKRGVRELCLYNYETREVYTVVCETEGEPDRWKYLRGLGFYEGRLLFSYNHDNRMYKLGMADLRAFLNGEAETFEAVFSERDFSGGVFQPALAKGEVYYRGAFASHDALMKFPEAGDVLSGRWLSLSLRPWNDEDRRLSGLPVSVPATEDAAAVAAASSGAELTSSRFRGFTYLNPLRFWLPYPLIRQDPDSTLGITLNGPAFFSMMMDPMDTNQIFLNVALDVPYLMGDITVSWLNLGLGFPITFEFSDTLDTNKSRYSGAVRDTIAAVRASFSRGLGNNRLHFSVSPEFQVRWSAPEPPGHSVWTAGPKSAYTWDYQEPYYLGILGLGVSNLSRFRWEVFGRGASLTAYGKYALRRGTPVAEQALPRLEGVFQAAFEPYLPLRFRLYGARDERGMNLAGQSASFSSAAFSGFASKEYVNTGRLRMTHLTWLAGGEAEAKLFKVEIQRDLSHLYFNRFFGTLAYRGAVYDDRGHPAAEGTVLTGSYRLAQSLVLRLGTEVSFAILPYIPFRLSASFVGVVKLSDTKKSGNKLWFGPEITFSY